MIKSLWVKVFHILIGLLLMASFSEPVWAQDNLEALAQGDYLKRENASERMTAMGNDLMGDRIDLNTGALSFQHTDISLPGNSNLEVAITRSRTPNFPFPHIDAGTSRVLKGHYAGGLDKSSAFSDWTLEVPKISMTVPIEANSEGGV